MTLTENSVSLALVTACMLAKSCWYNINQHHLSGENEEMPFLTKVGV